MHHIYILSLIGSGVNDTRKKQKKQYSELADTLTKSGNDAEVGPNDTSKAYTEDYNKY